MTWEEHEKEHGIVIEKLLYDVPDMFKHISYCDAHSQIDMLDHTHDGLILFVCVRPKDETTWYVINEKFLPELTVVEGED